MRVSRFLKLHGEHFDSAFISWAKKYSDMRDVWNKCGYMYLIKINSILGIDNYKSAIIMFCSWGLSYGTEYIREEKPMVFCNTVARTLRLYSSGTISDDDLQRTFLRSEQVCTNLKSCYYGVDLSMLINSSNILGTICQGQFILPLKKLSSSLRQILHTRAMMCYSAIESKLSQEFRNMIGHRFDREKK